MKLRIVFYFLLLLSHYAAAQVMDGVYMRKREPVSYAGKAEIIFDTLCYSPTVETTILPEDQPISNEEFTSYMVHSFSPLFPKMTISFKVAVSATDTPCCYNIYISDTSMVRPQSLELLKRTVLAYPFKTKLRFHPGEDKKIIRIRIDGNPNGKMNAELMPAKKE